MGAGRIRTDPGSTSSLDDRSSLIEPLPAPALPPAPSPDGKGTKSCGGDGEGLTTIFESCCCPTAVIGSSPPGDVLVQGFDVLGLTLITCPFAAPTMVGETDKGRFVCENGDEEVPNSGVPRWPLRAPALPGAALPRFIFVPVAMATFEETGGRDTTAPPR